MNEPFLLVGAGPIALQYSQILTDLGQKHLVVGRSEKSTKDFEEKTGIKPFIGGLEKWLSTKPACPQKAIVAVTETDLGVATLQLLNYGVPSILTEKPGAFTFAEIQKVQQVAQQKKADIYVAYNRRFYSSTKKALELIKQDGDISSFHFEFTEWSHVIAPLQKTESIKEEWFLQNSSHVLDLAFFLGGKPKEISCYKTGSLSWHPTGSNFSGAGITTQGALFNYCADWEAPGRWSVEILTKKHRFIFRPMEKLQVQKIGSVAIEMVELNDEFDQKYKPGYFQQVNQFLKNDKSNFCMIDEQAEMVDTYLKILNGTRK